MLYYYVRMYPYPYIPIPIASFIAIACNTLFISYMRLSDRGTMFG